VVGQSKPRSKENFFGLIYSYALPSEGLSKITNDLGFDGLAVLRLSIGDRSNTERVCAALYMVLVTELNRPDRKPF
jgi:hypothetical protein